MRRFLAGLCVAFAAAAVAVFLAPAFAVHEIGKEDAGKKPTTLRLKDDGITAELTIEGKGKITVTSKGIPMKPGTYKVTAIRIIKKDDKGKTWEVRSIVPDPTAKAPENPISPGADTLGSLATLTLDDGQDKVISVGPPFYFDCGGWPRTPNGDYFIRGYLRGQYSDIYYPMVFCDGKPGAVPTAHVLDEKGKTLWTGKFNCGQDGICEVYWSYGAFRGNFNVTVDPDMGPFEFKLKQQGRWRVD